MSVIGNECFVVLTREWMGSSVAPTEPGDGGIDVLSYVLDSFGGIQVRWIEITSYGTVGVD